MARQRVKSFGFRSASEAASAQECRPRRDSDSVHQSAEAVLGWWLFPAACNENSGYLALKKSSACFERKFAKQGYFQPTRRQGPAAGVPPQARRPEDEVLHEFVHQSGVRLRRGRS